MAASPALLVVSCYWEGAIAGECAQTCCSIWTPSPTHWVPQILKVALFSVPGASLEFQTNPAWLLLYLFQSPWKLLAPVASERLS